MKRMLVFKTNAGEWMTEFKDEPEIKSLFGPSIFPAPFTPSVFPEAESVFPEAEKEVKE